MPKRVLIVDDDEMVLMALEELLRPEGYEIQAVSSAAKALRLLDEGDYDLLMLDIIMPEMNGFDLCKKIREKENCKGTPIVFLSAKSKEEDSARGLEVGANLFLSKPISPDKLIKIVSRTIA